MKKYLSLAILLSGTAMAPLAHADDLSVSVSVDYVSEYVFRGVSFARGAVQPGIEISKNGFTAGVWTSAAIGEASAVAADEIDVYAGYSWALSDVVSADVGATIYHFPDTDGSLFDFGDASTFEVYGGLGFDVALAPSIYAYYDLDLLGLTAGLVTVDGPGDYEYGTLSASLGYGFTDDVSAYVGANYSLSSVDSLNFRNFTCLVWCRRRCRILIRLKFRKSRL